MIFGVMPGINYYALVKFPSSPDTLRMMDLTAGKTLEIYEMKGIPALACGVRTGTIRFFTDRENQPEIVKYQVIIMLLAAYNLRRRRDIRNIAIFRLLTSGFIFIVFVFVNQAFLFEWVSFPFFIPAIVALGLLAIQYLFIERILLKRMAMKEKLELREKLSRDLHDDLASTLGSISIYAETLKGMDEPAKPEFRRLPVKIAGLTQSALESISEIIWMTSPRNDSLQSLISKTSNYMFEILTDNKISFSSSVDIMDKPVILKEKVRNDAFLILKEGLHNILRHSGAKNVEFRAGIAESRCTISLRDDGAGFNACMKTKKGAQGNGLVNMRRRAQESGIGFDLRSEEGTGTEISLNFKI